MVMTGLLLGRRTAGQQVNLDLDFVGDGAEIGPFPFAQAEVGPLQDKATVKGPLGALGWLFTFKAMVIAQTLLVLPVVTALTCQLVADAERGHGEQLQSIGAGPVMRSLLLAWDERYALLTVLIASFGRAISEVGAVMIVGGNIDGFTRVMTTAIALETSKGDLPLALALGLVLLTVVLVLPVRILLVCFTWQALAILR